MEKAILTVRSFMILEWFSECLFWDISLINSFHRYYFIPNIRSYVIYIRKEFVACIVWENHEFPCYCQRVEILSCDTTL